MAKKSNTPRGLPSNSTDQTLSAALKTDAPNTNPKPESNSVSGHIEQPYEALSGIPPLSAPVNSKIPPNTRLHPSTLHSADPHTTASQPGPTRNEIRLNSVGSLHDPSAN